MSKMLNFVLYRVLVCIKRNKTISPTVHTSSRKERNRVTRLSHDDTARKDTICWKLVGGGVGPQK